MHIDRFTLLTAGLRDLGGQRVWSLMISLFGDLAQDAGQSIDGPLLSAIMAHLQVKPEAVRVALHRLRNDGWVLSQKSGRISQHSFTKKGRAECASANPRIYADPSLDLTGWQLVLTKGTSLEQSSAMIEQGFTAISTRIFVGPSDAPLPAEAMGFPAQDAPDWLRQEIAPRAQHENYHALLATLSALNEDLLAYGALSPVEIAVLRCLIVHNWRRIVLKQPMLPSALIDPAGPSHRCHLSVAGLLSRLERPRLSEIAQDCAAT